jgi:glucose-6-phosphate-specific signal transduction histidine kinase
VEPPKTGKVTSLGAGSSSELVGSVRALISASLPIYLAVWTEAMCLIPLIWALFRFLKILTFSPLSPSNHIKYVKRHKFEVLNIGKKSN